MTITHVFCRYVASPTNRMGGCKRIDGAFEPSTAEQLAAFDAWLNDGPAPAWATTVELPDPDPATIDRVFAERGTR